MIRISKMMGRRMKPNRRKNIPIKRGGIVRMNRMMRAMMTSNRILISKMGIGIDQIEGSYEILF